MSAVSAPASPASIDTRRPPGLLVTCLLICLLEGYDISSVGVAAPLMMHDLGLAPSLMGTAFSIGMVGVMLGSFFFGWAADRFGRKLALLATLLLLGASSFGSALTGSFATLAFARFATGMAIGGALPAVLALISECSPPGRRTIDFTLASSGFPLGGMAVALVAASGLFGTSWRWLFFTGGLLPLLLLPVAWKFLVETRPQSARAGAHPPVLLRAALFAGPRKIATPLLGLACIVTQFAFYLLLSWLPLLLLAGGFPVTSAPWAAFVFSSGNLLGAPAVGFMIARYGQRRPTTLVYLLFALVMVAFTRAPTLPTILFTSFLAGFLANGGQIAVYSIAPAFYEGGARGTGVGAVIGVGRIGSILGPLGAGLLIANGVGVNEMLLMLAVILPLGALSVLLLPNTPALS